MRLIDADALDAAFTDLRFNADGTLAHWGDRPDWCLHGREVEKLIHDAPTVGGWISVKDRLPGINEDVLILYESKVLRETDYAITCLKDSFYFGGTPIPYQTPQWEEPWQYFRKNNVITHWMPLPEPPKEDNA